MPPSICSYCNKPAETVCSSCCTVAYCTVECQVAHWQQDHKVECKTMHLVPGSGQFWTPRRAAAFVKVIFPEEPCTDFEKNIELLATSFWVTPDELKEFIEPRSVALRAELKEEIISLLIPPAVQAEMEEIRKSIKSCKNCGRHCGQYCGATRHVYGWDLID